MALDRIRLGDFRNHPATGLDGTARFNLLVGPNGAGKTNVLEALSLFAPGRGLRRARLEAMVRSGAANGFTIGADLVSGTTPVRLGTAMRPDAPSRRVVLASGAPLPAARLAEWLSLSWLTPAMDRLFADSASARRRFLDRMVLALLPAHAVAASAYERAMRERNLVLGREGSTGKAADPHWLDALERLMAEAGAAVAESRAAIVTRLNERLAGLPDAPFARPLLAIETGDPATDAAAFAEGWRRTRSRDRAAGRTLSGPHRDDLAVTMAGTGRAAAECSTGEQKALLIAITLAHAELAAGTRPLVLLLDEVAAHLDPLRREALFARLAASGAQIWMTGTEPEPFAAIAGTAAVWHLSEGSTKKRERE